MLAFLFIVGPNEFNTLAQADILYSNLDTSTWAVTGTTIEYDYDNNGSLIRKITWTGEIDTGTKTREIIYAYSLQNRLARMRTDDTPLITTDWEATVDYEYNDSGVRVSQREFEATFDADGYITAIRNDGSEQEKTILYIIAAANHTGYAQPIAELTYDDTINPNPAVDAPDSIRSYTIGDDVLAQTDDPTGTPSVEYLLYDGHGSTRQLTDANIDGSGDIIESFSYDGYGVMLGGNPTSTSPAATSLLYTGEQFDTNAQQYYLRARYYNQNNGRFNRMDPFSGNTQDPQSLHKYLYCHNNPVNAIDPLGLFSITQIAVTSAIIGVVAGIITYAITGSVKTAVVVGVLAALLTVAVMTAITYWPQIIKAFKSMMDYQSAHRTVSNRVFQRMNARCGTDIGARLRFFNHLQNLSGGGKALWLKQLGIGVGQKLMTALMHPIQFLQWLNPTPAAWVGVGVAAVGVVVYVVWRNRDDIKEFINEWRR